MEHWWIYLLTFFFGYVTCKTFYFFRSARLSLVLLRASHIIYLSALIKSLEHLSYAREIMLEHLLRTNKGSAQISSFALNFDEDTRLLKSRSISTFLDCHPSFFRTMIEFDDWNSAMKYLQENKEVALKFWEKHGDDR